MGLRILICGLVLGTIFHATATELARQAYLGVNLRVSGPPTTGAEISGINSPEVAAKLGFKTGDHILQINSIEITSSASLSRALRTLHGGDKALFKIMREGRALELAGVLDALPKEKLPGVDVLHDAILTDAGYRLRAIITRPKNKPGKLPVIFLVGWLSCDSVEYPLVVDDGFGQLLHDIASHSGMVLFRVDKPGTGDSEGPACRDLDLKTELAAYQAAFRSLQHYDFIDTNQITVLGMSNGGGFAPLVAKDAKIKSFIVAGGWVKTWFEHMIELERRRVQLSGMPLERIAGAMRGYSEFYDDYLIRKKTPGEIIQAKPNLADLWYDQPDHQYGRPASFYHQLEDLDLLGAWARVDVPVLAIHGEYDWIMSREDHEIIAALVNKNHPGNGRFVELPKTNHLLFSYPSSQEAFKNASSGRYNPAATSVVLEFLGVQQ
jgi:pimeloyl-ACP methyl ester carboxylesterase